MAKKAASGGGRLKTQGRKLIWVTADQAQQSAIRMAAAASGLPMSQFLLQTGLEAAEKILKKAKLGLT